MSPAAVAETSSLREQRAQLEPHIDAALTESDVLRALGQAWQGISDALCATDLAAWHDEQAHRTRTRMARQWLIMSRYVEEEPGVTLHAMHPPSHCEICDRWHAENP